MAKIPQFGNLNLNGARGNIPNVPNGVPGAINSLANLVLQKKKEDDQLQYQKALLDLDEFGSEELYNPNTGFKNLQGENAINEVGSYNQRYTDKINEIRETLKGNSFLDNFDLKTQDMHTSHARQLMLHESKQQSALALQTMKAGIDLAVKTAETQYGDPMSLDMGFNNIASRLDEYSAEQGMPTELRQAQKESLAQQYFSSSLDGWIANTELNGGSFTELGNEMKQSFAFNQLSEINQAKYLLKLEALNKKQVNENKDNLTLDLNNNWEMQKRGIEAPEIPLERFTTVYGDKGKQAYDTYQDKQVMARNIAAMQNMPSSELEQLKKENTAVGATVDKDPLVAIAGDDNYSNRLKLQGYRIEAANILLGKRKEDPIAAAYQAGEVSELDFANNETLQNTLSQRIAQAARISQDYQTPLQIFSKTEKDFMASMFEKQSAPEVNDMLKTFRQSAGDNIPAYNAILKQVGISHPSIAFAGGVLNTGKDVKVKDKGGLFSWFSDPMYENPEQISSTIILGRQSRKGVNGQNGYQTPSGTNNDPKVYFDDYVGDTFKGSWGAYDDVYQTALDYYAGESVKVGDFSKDLNKERWDKAIRVATGGIIDFNGAKTILPYGMDETAFLDVINDQYYKKVVAKGIVEDKSKLKTGTSRGNVTPTADNMYQNEYPFSDTDYLDVNKYFPHYTQKKRPDMPYQLDRRKDGQYHIVNGTTYLYEGEGDNVKAIVLDVYEDN